MEKKVVHCTNQKEWDFVTKRLGYTWKFAVWGDNEGNSCINLNNNLRDSIKRYQIRNYQILSFREWLDENGYNDSKFIPGKWYKALIFGKCWYLHFKSIKSQGSYNQINHYMSIVNGKIKLNDYIANSDIENKLELLEDLTEIQQFLPKNHPDKIISEVKELPEEGVYWGNNSDIINYITSVREKSSTNQKLNDIGIAWNKYGWWPVSNNSAKPECSKEFLLQLIDKLKFDRNWHVKVNSQEEANKVFDWLESQGERVNTGFTYDDGDAPYIVFNGTWLLNQSAKNFGKLKSLRDILPEYISKESKIDFALEKPNLGLFTANRYDHKPKDFDSPVIIESKIIINKILTF